MGKRKVTILEQAIEEVARIALFIEGEGLPKTATHSGRYCYGKTPMQTFKESLILARQKMIGHPAPAA